MDRSRYKVAWLIPKLIEGSGGHRTMFQNIQALIARGYECHVYLEPEDGSKPPGKKELETARTQLNSFFGATDSLVRLGFDLQEPYDLVFATAWYTARIARDLTLNCQKAYFVQDFEASFNPMGDGFLLAANSYRMGLRPITIGRWLTHKLARDYNCRSSYFDFCADKNVYCRDHSILKEKAVCFICQPEKPRRCSRIGIETLGILKHYMPDVNIYLYGSNEPVHTWFDHSNLGLIPITQCNELYNRCMVGLCISSTNPSRIPFEMMAAGLPVVDLYGENNLYDMPDAGVLLADPIPEALAKALAILLSDESRRTSMSHFATEFMSDRSLESGYDQFVSAVDRIMTGDFTGITGIRKMYNRGPVRAETAEDLRAVDSEHTAAPTGQPPRSPTDHAVFLEDRARADLESIENSRTWRWVLRIKNNILYRLVARLRFGPHWDYVDPNQPATLRLARVKASRPFRIMQALKRTRLYKWYARRKSGNSVSGSYR